MAPGKGASAIHCRAGARLAALDSHFRPLGWLAATARRPPGFVGPWGRDLGLQAASACKRAGVSLSGRPAPTAGLLGAIRRCISEELPDYAAPVAFGLAIRGSLQGWIWWANSRGRFQTGALRIVLLGGEVGLTGKSASAGLGSGRRWAAAPVRKTGHWPGAFRRLSGSTSRQVSPPDSAAPQTAWRGGSGAEPGGAGSPPAPVGKLRRAKAGTALGMLRHATSGAGDRVIRPNCFRSPRPQHGQVGGPADHA